MILSRAQIDQAIDRQLVAVDVPEWGGSVMLRPLSLQERYAFLEFARAAGAADTAHADVASIQARLIQLCACDEHGGRLWGDTELQHIASRSSAVVDRLFQSCQALCGMSAERPT